MKICTQTHGMCARFGDEEGIRRLSAAGFDSVDYTMYSADADIFALDDDELIRRYTELRRVIEDEGMYVYQTHSPFPTVTADKVRNEAMIGILRKSLLISSILGAKYSVVHPSNYGVDKDGNSVKQIYDRNKDEVKATNMEFYQKLVPYIRKYGVKLAIENMWTRDPARNNVKCKNVCSSPYDLADYIDTLNAMCGEELFVACLDVGHINLSCRDMSAREIVNVLGGRLKSLHVHDTDGVEDNHTAPGFGTIDFSDFMSGLRDVGYDGDFVFEADEFYKRFDEALLPDAAALLCKIGRNMCEKFGM